MVNSLAQLVLKIASPGVPDFYQGTELWDLTLWSIPTTGAPVDFDAREQLATEALELLLNEPCDRTTRIAKPSTTCSRTGATAASNSY